MIPLHIQSPFYKNSHTPITNEHVIDFHTDWIAKGFIKPQDFNMNMIQDPEHYRIDILPQSIKERVSLRYREHIAVIKPLDDLGRATGGFESALNMMMSDDKTHLIPKFKQITAQLDQRRSQKTEEVFPELKELLVD